MSLRRRRPAVCRRRSPAGPFPARPASELPSTPPCRHTPLKRSPSAPASACAEISGRSSRSHRYDDCRSLRLTGCGPANAGQARTLLLPFDRPRPLRSARRIRAARRRRWAHAVNRSLLGAHPFGGLRAAAGARFDLLPFQLEPALAMLRHGRLRLLIADAVGLGKTIQTGIILNELAAAADGFRARHPHAGRGTRAVAARTALAFLTGNDARRRHLAQRERAQPPWLTSTRGRCPGSSSRPWTW